MNTQTFCITLIGLGQCEAAGKLLLRTEEEWLACEGDVIDFDGTPVQVSRKLAEDEVTSFDWLISSFDWNRCPEGYDFWSHVADILEAKPKS